MAIKGKGRTRGRRAVAAPPRPQVVVRKPPVWRRRSTLVALATMAVLGIGLAVVLSIRSARAEDRRTQEVAVLRRFTSQVHAALPEDRQAPAPDLILVFPALPDDLDLIESGELPRGQTRQRAADVEQAARRAAEGLDTVVVSDVVPAEFRGLRSQLQDAQYLLVQSFRIYESVGRLMSVTPGLQGDQLDVVVVQAERLTARATGLFIRGYQKILSAFTARDVPPPAVPAVPLQPAVTPPAAEEPQSPEPSPTA